MMFAPPVDYGAIVLATPTPAPLNGYGLRWDTQWDAKEHHDCRRGTILGTFVLIVDDKKRLIRAFRSSTCDAHTLPKVMK